MDILIAEDDRVTATALRKQLDNMGHQVVQTVSNYHDAIDVPASKNIDLALLDINLIGKETGIDIARVFQSKYNLPCIFLTSTSNDFIINQVREIGVYGYLLKPFSTKDIFTAIEIAEVRFKNDQLNAKKNMELERLVAQRTLELKNTNQQLEEEISYTMKLQKDLEEAEINERKRIAANLHDGVCQTLTAAKFSLSGISRTLALNGAMEEAFKSATTLIEDALREIREISHRLTPSDIETRGLGVALQNLFDRLNDLNVLQLHAYNHQDLPILSLYQQTVIYRTIQEALNNIIKHASATRVEVHRRYLNGKLTFTISDNGKGFNLEQVAQSSGIGLKNIQERCHAIGAHLSITSAPGKGTTVQITLNTNQNGTD